MRRIVILVALPSALTFAVSGAAASTPAPFFDGFEANTDGWFGAVTRVASGTNGVGSATGSYHAEAAGTSVFTRWGGYADTFPANGYTTSLDSCLHVDDSNQGDCVSYVATGGKNGGDG